MPPARVVVLTGECADERVEAERRAAALAADGFGCEDDPGYAC